jgi:hypothetical protein
MQVEAYREKSAPIVDRAMRPVSYAATAVASGRRISVQSKRSVVCQLRMIQLTDFDDRWRTASIPAD